MVKVVCWNIGKGVDPWHFLAKMAKQCEADVAIPSGSRACTRRPDRETRSRRQVVLAPDGVLTGCRRS